jgi:hypothetical protein
MAGPFGSDSGRRCFEFLHLRIEIRERETYVVNGTSAARLRVIFLEKQ